MALDTSLFQVMLNCSGVLALWTLEETLLEALLMDPFLVVVEFHQLLSIEPCILAVEARVLSD